MSCGHACNCETYGSHLRAKNIRIGDVKPFSQQRAWDRELDAYEAVRKQGIQPASTQLKDIRKAEKISNETGVAFDAGHPG